MKRILQSTEKVLREIAKEIPVSDIAKPKIQKVIKEMFESLAQEKDGVALAAPQIGYSLRIFVVSPKVFENPEDFNKIFINPKILKKSKDSKKMEEGCLSCRWLYGKTKRSTKVTLEAYNEKGEKIVVEASKLPAQIFQHEIDHLDGILFIDHATNIKEFEPEEDEE